MHEYKVILTWEAIYDVTDLTDYIEADFGRERADRFQNDIKNEMTKLGYMGSMFPKTQFWYRSYVIYKKPFPPSIIFYIVKESEKEIHVLRVLREEHNWGRTLTANSPMILIKKQAAL